MNTAPSLDKKPVRGTAISEVEAIPDEVKGKWESTLKGREEDIPHCPTHFFVDRGTCTKGR